VSALAVSDLKDHTTATFRRGPHVVALFAAVLTVPLLYVGGSVTTYRVGLAVPDWPQTFGINMFLYDFWNAPFGVRLEHSHRLYGAAVGLATVFLAVWFGLFERRRWLKVLSAVALVAVIVQGILGGTRVTEVSTLLAALHGAVGQGFFALIVALCVFTGRKWQERPAPILDRDHLRRRAVVLLALVAAQIALGSWLRHYGTWAAVASHGILALAVWGHALALEVRVEKRRLDLAPLVLSARSLLVLSTVQMLLGVASFVYLLPFDGTPRAVSFYQAVFRTGHQTTGALVLAAAVIVALRSFGLVERRVVAGEPSDAPVNAGSTGGRQMLEWEAAL
jgi:cytochrome c oxidase assembly protein subunit 15